jgi:hypothetical protein
MTARQVQKKFLTLAAPVAMTMHGVPSGFNPFRAMEARFFQ